MESGALQYGRRVAGEGGEQVQPAAQRDQLERVDGHRTKRELAL